MIVKLCMSDLLKLTNDEAVVIDNLTVRTTTDEKSSYYHESYQSSANYREEISETIGARRSNARRKITGQTKTGQKWMKALFPGRCYFPNCRNAIVKGDLIVYDYDGRRSLCEGHGKTEYPNLPKPEEVNA